MMREALAGAFRAGEQLGKHCRRRWRSGSADGGREARGSRSSETPFLRTCGWIERVTSCMQSGGRCEKRARKGSRKVWQHKQVQVATGSGCGAAGGGPSAMSS